MLHDLERTMVVAMIAVRMVEAPVDEVIDMVSMGYRLMAAIWTMPMRCIVPSRRLVGRAAIRVLGCYFDDMVIDAAVFNVLEVPLIKIIDVVGVPNRDVATSRAVNVRLGARCHDTSFHAFMHSGRPDPQAGK
jgi:hypothetical protein